MDINLEHQIENSSPFFFLALGKRPQALLDMIALKRIPYNWNKTQNPTTKKPYSDPLRS